MEISRLTRDGTAEPVSRGQILRRERGQGNIHFPCSADHVQGWQPYPVDDTLAICVPILTMIHWSSLKRDWRGFLSWDMLFRLLPTTLLACGQRDRSGGEIPRADHTMRSEPASQSHRTTRSTNQTHQVVRIREPITLCDEKPRAN